MDDLVQWLGKQLDEDERIARQAPGPVWEHRQVRGDFDESVVFEDYVAVADPTRNVVVFSDVSTEMLAFALRHDPARVLRETDAKRQIAAWHRQPTQQEFSSGRYRTMGCRCGDGWPCVTLRLLALPYADRPGYQESWRP